MNSKDGLQGEEGIVYNYIFAVNGVFLHCHNELLDATIKISEAQIRGLAYLERKVELKKGKYPVPFWTWHCQWLSPTPAVRPI